MGLTEVVVQVVALVPLAFAAWVVRGQQRQLEEMQRLLASRTFTEYTRAVQSLEQPRPKPVEEDDGGYARAFEAPHGHD